jgi:hypothetical protein
MASRSRIHDPSILYVSTSVEILDTPSIMRLPPDEFARRFYAAINGEENVFSPYIRVARGRLAPHIWKPIRARILERDAHTCRYCGATDVPLDVDHVIPLTRGGSNRDDNLVAACYSCNRSKSNKLVEEWTR